MLNLGTKSDASDVSKLSDQELISTLAQQAKELGIDISWIIRSICPKRLKRRVAAAGRSTRPLPQRMTATAQASGAWCWQRSHQSHQGVACRSSPRVGAGPGCIM